MARTFGSIGRFLAITNAIAMPGIGIWRFTDSSVLALYVGFMAIIVGLIEVPLLCSCMSICVKIARVTRVIGGFWTIRAIIYILISAGGFAIYQLKVPNMGGEAPGDDLYLLATQISLVCSAALYILAQYKKEPNPGDGHKGPSSSSSSSPSKGGKDDSGASVGAAVGGFFGRSAAKAIKNNPEAVSAAAAAAAPSIAQQMFGGGSSSSSGGEPKGFYDDEETAGAYVAPSVPLTAGSSSSGGGSSSARDGSPGGSGGGGFGGFFGGGKSKSKTASSPAPAPAPAPSAPAAAGPGSGKGMYDDDLPESNPFLS